MQKNHINLLLRENSIFLATTKKKERKNGFNRKKLTLREFINTETRVYVYIKWQEHFHYSIKQTRLKSHLIPICIVILSDTFMRSRTRCLRNLYRSIHSQLMNTLIYRHGSVDITARINDVMHLYTYASTWSNIDDSIWFLCCSAADETFLLSLNLIFYYIRCLW